MIEDRIVETLGTWLAQTPLWTAGAGTIVLGEQPENPAGLHAVIEWPELDLTPQGFGPITAVGTCRIDVLLPPSSTIVTSGDALAWFGTLRHQFVTASNPVLLISMRTVPPIRLDAADALPGWWHGPWTVQLRAVYDPGTEAARAPRLALTDGGGIIL